MILCCHFSLTDSFENHRDGRLGTSSPFKGLYKYQCRDIGQLLSQVADFDRWRSRGNHFVMTRLFEWKAFSVPHSESVGSIYVPEMDLLEDDEQ